MHPNVLLVVFDTARADAFEPYGAPSGSSPVVADLARRGAVEPQTYATANWTLPSHASMFTGGLPRIMGLDRSPDPREAMARHVDVVLPEVLRRSGYVTSAVSANVFISPVHGFDVGFDRFESVMGTRRPRPDEGARSRLRWSLDAVQARLDDGLAAADATVRRWLAEGPGRPFFWFVNLMECHSPYLPPKPWNDLNLVARYRAGEDARRYQSHDGLIRVSLGEIEVPDASIERMRHLYRRSVSAMDDWLGRMLGTLDERGLLDETLVIVSSDHGENLGEGHMLGHAMSVDERLIHVPFVAAGPGSEAWKRRRSSEGNVSSLADVPRILADAAGIPDHPWHRPAVPAGVAVAQCDGFAALAPDTAQKLVEAWRLWPRAHEELFLRRSCATDGRFKLVRERDAARLHDLETDPLETTDVLAAHPEEAARLASVLDALDAEEEAAKARDVPERAASSGGDGGSAGAAESAELEERLKLLGYL